MRINIINNMPNTQATAALASESPAQDRASGQAAVDSHPMCSNTSDPCFTWQSTELLQGHKRVHIAHNGGVYQLQATRQGKLILTK